MIVPPGLYRRMVGSKGQEDESTEKTVPAMFVPNVSEHRLVALLIRTRAN